VKTVANQTLWNIGEQMQALDDLLADCEWNDPKTQQTLQAWADEIGADFAIKLDNCCAFIRTLEARIDARKEEAARLAGRATVDSNNLKHLKEYVLKVMEWHKVKTIDTPRFKVTARANGGKQPLECLVKPEDLPPELQIRNEEIKANIDEIRRLLEAGTLVGGCRLLPRGTSLSVK